MAKNLFPVASDIGADIFHNNGIFGEGVVVVIDEHLNVNHPDLKENIMWLDVDGIDSCNLMYHSINLQPFVKPWVESREKAEPV